MLFGLSAICMVRYNYSKINGTINDAVEFERVLFLAFYAIVWTN